MTHRLITVLCCLATSSAVFGQQCNTSINSTTPIHRFVLAGDGTVTDSRSGLQWQRCPVGYELDDNNTPGNDFDDQCEVSGDATFTWQAALQSAADLNAGGGFGGFTDWRVATLKELGSIVEFKCQGPAINSWLFPNTEPDLFWSSTTVNRIGSALVLNFRSGTNSFSSMEGVGAEHYVRLVRGGT